MHPEVAPHANRRAADLIRQMGGGKISQDLVDEYPRPLSPVVVEMPLSEIKRNLGITIPPNEVVHILTSLDFQVTKKESVLQVTVPNHRMDIGSGQAGIADILEEIARIYGFERIPETQISDTIPRQQTNIALEAEERVCRGLRAACA